MNKNYIIILLIICFTGVSSFASRDVSNGGDGIVIDGTPYLYDLVEAGVHRNPNFNDRITTLLEIKNRVDKIFIHARDLDTELVAKKLTEIYHVDKIFSAALLRVMEMYSWRWVDFSLFEIPDDGDTVVHFGKHELVQLAARYKRSITIDSKIWLKMPQSNRVALLFHEVIYALIAPTQVTEHVFIQDANLARQITSFFFTGELAVGKGALNEILNGHFPNESEIFYKKNNLDSENKILNIGFNRDEIIFGSHIKFDVVSKNLGDIVFFITTYSDHSGVYKIPVDFNGKKSINEAFKFVCTQIINSEYDTRVYLRYLFHKETLKLSFEEFLNKRQGRASYIKFSINELDTMSGDYQFYKYDSRYASDYELYFPPYISNEHYLNDGYSIKKKKKTFKERCSKGAPTSRFAEWYNDILRNYKWIE